MRRLFFVVLVAAIIFAIFGSVCSKILKFDGQTRYERSLHALHQLHESIYDLIALEGGRPEEKRVNVAIKSTPNLNTDESETGAAGVESSRDP